MDWLDKEIEKCGYFNFLFVNKKELVLFGASGIARDFIGYWKGKDKECPVKYIIDNDVSKMGMCIDDIPIISYESFEQREKENVKVLLTGRKIYQTYCDTVRCGINKEDIWFPNSSYVVKGDFMDIDWIVGNPVYSRMLDIYFSKDSIKETYMLLGDEESREVFKAVIRFRLTLNPVNIMESCHCTNSNYFESAPFDLERDENFVDIGALRGDSTLEFLHKCQNEYQHIYVIEPDETGLCKAMDSIFTLENLEKVSYYHLAISNYCGLTAFDGSVLGEGRKLVRTMKLDTLFDKKRISLIKMDIEGQERNALNGSAELLKNQKPKLCICVYHHSDDLWLIPQLIKRINNQYKIYIRQDSPGVYGDVQTVCYAY